MIMAFVDQMKTEGRAVESTCTVLSSLGVPVAARTYRAWKAAQSVSSRMLELAYLMNAIHTVAFLLDPLTGKNRLRPEGLYGRRKMTASLRRAGHQVSYGRVHTAMAALGHHGVVRSRKTARLLAPGRAPYKIGSFPRDRWTWRPIAMLPSSNPSTWWGELPASGSCFASGKRWLCALTSSGTNS